MDRTVAHDRRNNRRRSIRMKEFDYASDAQWFVTICTYNKICTLGGVVDDEMKLSTYGKIVEEELLQTGNLRPNVLIDEYIIMPNHVHMILEITGENQLDPCRGVARYAPTTPEIKTYNPTEKQKRLISPKSKSLGATIRSFKSAVTKRIHELQDENHEPIWQRNYWEHGIRTDKELERIQEYVQENPLHWDEDPENPLRR